MPLARIITRFPQDASSVAEYFSTRGYDIETEDPMDPRGSAVADIELSIDRCSSSDALARAAALAEYSGVDIFVAPGTLKAPIAHEAAAPAPVMHEAAVHEAAAPAPVMHEAAVREVAAPAFAALEDSDVPAIKLAPTFADEPPSPERRVTYARSARHPLTSAYWRGAFTGAAVAAIAVMIAWAVASGRPPSTPPSSDGTVVQNVPFGPVTLTPAATKAPVMPVAPTSKIQSQPAAQPAPRASAAAPRVPTQKTSAGRVRHARARAAEDEVIVRHFNSTTDTAKPKTPDTATASKTGPRRITDQ